jgi:large subunit ribosomal protein L30
MSKPTKTKPSIIVVIRIRSGIGLRQEAKETLEFLNLTRVNHAVLIDNRPSYRGMLQKAKDAITWGEVDSPTLTRMLRKRGRLEGNRRLTNDYVAKHTPFKTIEDFARALLASETELTAIPKLKKVFRLHPPSKGFRGSIKRTIQQKGELGNRGPDINSLLYRMA